jgi:hypothetical protein
VKAERVTVGDGAAGRSDGRVAPEADAGQQAAAQSQQPLCSFALCPICMTLTALGEARPELITHVLLASREVLLALRAVIDARLEGTADAGPAPTMQHLTIS